MEVPQPSQLLDRLRQAIPASQSQNRELLSRLHPRLHLVSPKTPPQTDGNARSPRLVLPWLTVVRSPFHPVRSP
ncbi:MAG: hypothetical protein P5683_07395 [Limnospira sp. PMC 1279.21]|nr:MULTISPECIES: hypothetical protein [unclassified Limnospira]MDT9178441.1 hypothetical protein [Limnospira sp. PMC 1238.20]MDT9193073.1 hypothetical protein [Limnospira sp. PMC 1245.20]MDT9203523.1 hypothetical protein [Limnospira sp. PMC 1243.20]MDT9223453.1 hypothetical protein [Limnospira sp. PMC 1279.21]MDT9240220.1 hypothetical protein [Limnospira sp. PMC 1261.20]